MAARPARRGPRSIQTPKIPVEKLKTIEGKLRPKGRKMTEEVPVVS